MRRALYYCSFFVILLLLTSCRYLEGRFWVAMGNYHYDRGTYLEAISYYKKGIEDLQFKPWIYYNLGLTYAALSENESALEMWEQAKELVDQPFLFYLYYNEGLVFFYQGLYSQSFDSFKRALHINPYDRDAKINLELALDKMRNLGSTMDMMFLKASHQKQLTPQEQELLESIQQSEATQWTANRQIAPSSTESDY